MNEDIPLARPSITEAERSAALRVLSGSRLTGGPERTRFELMLAENTGRAHAIAVSSGTAALELSLWALGVGQGDRVLVTAFGFPAAANAVAARGAIPVAIDVDPDTWLMDFDLAREAIDTETVAVVTIDQLGAVTRGADIQSLEGESGLPVISDAACGLGGRDQDHRAAGGVGRLATFSFHPRKVITTGEGGAVLCDDPELANRLRQLRNHGQSEGGLFASIGTNARLDEVACSIGCAQMSRIDPMIAERKMLAAGYQERLSDLQSAGLLQWQQLPEGSQHVYQSFAVLLHEGSDRDQVLAGLRERQISCGIATYSFPEIEVHKGNRAAPVAKALHERAISLPIYIGMRSPELSRVSDALEELLS